MWQELWGGARGYGVGARGYGVGARGYGSHEILLSALGLGVVLILDSQFSILDSLFYLSIYLSIYLYIYLSFSLSIYFSLSLFLSLSLSLSLYLSLSIYLSISVVSVCLSPIPSIYPIKSSLTFCIQTKNMLTWIKAHLKVIFVICLGTRHVCGTW